MLSDSYSINEFESILQNKISLTNFEEKKNWLYVNSIPDRVNFLKKIVQYWINNPTIIQNIYYLPRRFDQLSHVTNYYSFIIFIIIINEYIKIYFN